MNRHKQAEGVGLRAQPGTASPSAGEREPSRAGGRGAVCAGPRVTGCWARRPAVRLEAAGKVAMGHRLLCSGRGERERDSSRRLLPEISRMTSRLKTKSRIAGAVNRRQQGEEGPPLCTPERPGRRWQCRASALQAPQGGSRPGRPPHPPRLLPTPLSPVLECETRAARGRPAVW